MGEQTVVLAVGAYPPPISGQAVAMQLVVDQLRSELDVREFDVADPLDEAGARAELRRAAGLLVLESRAAIVMARHRRRAVLYLQLGQARASILRDLPMLLAAAVLRVPVLGHVHGSTYAHGFRSLPLPLRRVVARVMRRVHVVVLTDALRTTVSDVVTPRGLHVVANGVDPALAELPPAVGATAGDAPLRLLYLSNLLPEKGYVDVLEAARLAAEAGLPWRFVLAGYETSTMTVHPRDFISRHAMPNTTYVGGATMEERISLLQEADILLFPSRREGQPMTILEAQWLGVPSIAYPVGGVVDTVTHLGDGYLLDTDAPDPAAHLVEAIAAIGRPEVLGPLSEAAAARARRDNAPEVHGRRIAALLHLVREAA